MDALKILTLDTVNFASAPYDKQTNAGSKGGFNMSNCNRGNKPPQIGCGRRGTAEKKRKTITQSFEKGGVHETYIS